MSTVPELNGVKNVTCNGDHWFLMYKGSKCCLKGKLCGQITSGNPEVTIEYFDMQVLMEVRYNELGLEEAYQE